METMVIQFFRRAEICAGYLQVLLLVVEYIFDEGQIIT